MFTLLDTILGLVDCLSSKTSSFNMLHASSDASISDISTVKMFAVACFSWQKSELVLRLALADISDIRFSVFTLLDTILGLVHCVSSNTLPLAKSLDALV